MSSSKAPDGDLASNDLEPSDSGPGETRMSGLGLFLILASVFVAAACGIVYELLVGSISLVFPGEQRRAILPDDWLLSFRDGPGLVDLAGRSRQIDPAAGGIGNLARVVRGSDSSRSVPRLCLHRRLPVRDARRHPDHRHTHRAGNPPPDTDSEKTRIVTDDPVKCAFGRLRRRSGGGCSLPVFLFAGSRSVFIHHSPPAPSTFSPVRAFFWQCGPSYRSGTGKDSSFRASWFPVY